MNRRIQMLALSFLLVSATGFDPVWGRGAGASVSVHQYSVSRPARFGSTSGIVRGSAYGHYPTAYGNGSRISLRAASVPPSQHASIAANVSVVRNIQSRQRVEIVPNHYYWHNVGDVRYCHFFDRGIHWYGFYFGSSFYWTRFYSGYWWWFDPGFTRWVFWWDGYWWWPGPNGQDYVYVDNNYYPYDENDSNVTVKEPEVAPPQQQNAPEQNVPATVQGSSTKSPDGRRMVQVSGSESEAFLYDTTGASPSFMKYLGKNVDRIRFSGGINGKPVQILTEFKDGSFSLSSENGDPLEQDPAANSKPDASPPSSDDQLPMVAPTTSNQHK